MKFCRENGQYFQFLLNDKIGSTAMQNCLNPFLCEKAMSGLRLSQKCARQTQNLKSHIFLALWPGSYAIFRVCEWRKLRFFLKITLIWRPIAPPLLSWGHKILYERFLTPSKTYVFKNWPPAVRHIHLNKTNSYERNRACEWSKEEIFKKANVLSSKNNFSKFYDEKWRILRGLFLKSRLNIEHIC